MAHVTLTCHQNQAYAEMKLIGMDIADDNLSSRDKMATNLVNLDDIHVSFQGNSFGHRLRVLEGICLVVPDSQFLTVLGPSGCGKSTLLRVMAGLLPPDRGTIRWQDGLLENRASRMAMNFQKPVLLPWLSVQENGLLPFRLKANGIHRAVEADVESRLLDLLNLTGLAKFRRSLPHELSGGMQMRAALLRTLISKPDLVFMDEPFASIDELTRQDLGREFRSIAQTSKASTVFVTHSIQEAAFLSDRIIILSPRPSHIVEDIEVRYSNPQRTDALRRDREFLDICDHLREIMAHG